VDSRVDSPINSSTESLEDSITLTTLDFLSGIYTMFSTPYLVTFIDSHSFDEFQVRDQQMVVHMMEALLKSRSILLFLFLPLCFVLSPSFDFVHTNI